MDAGTVAHTTQCSDNTVAAFIDGRLGARERRAFIEHLAECERCRATIVQSIGMLGEAVPGPSARRSWRVAVAPVIALTAAAALVLVAGTGLRAVRGSRTADAAKSVSVRPPAHKVDGRPLTVDVRTPNRASEFERWYADSTAAPFDQWFRAQPRMRIEDATGNQTPVVIVLFNDFQCQLCAEAYREYSAIVARYEAQQPGAVKLVLKDYPLNRDCNPYLAGTLHPLACDAAVAARVVPANRRAAMAEWLFTHQASMTAASAREAAQNTGGVTISEHEYAGALTRIRDDVTLGRELLVESTPTLFVNGVRIVPMLPPHYLDMAVADELSPSRRNR